MAAKDAALEVRLDGVEGPVIARGDIKSSASWATLRLAAQHVPTGRHDLVVVLTAGGPVDLDWLRFKSDRN